MKAWYLKFEEIQKEVETLLRRNDIRKVYNAVLFAAIYAALLKRKVSYEHLSSLAETIPPHLLGEAKGKLHRHFLDLISVLEEALRSRKPVIVDGEANLQVVLGWLKKEIGSVDYVVLYDCLSPIELLVISSYLLKSGFYAKPLGRVFINPVGLTRFVTSQLSEQEHPRTLHMVAQHIARELGARGADVNPLVDRIVHESGLKGIKEFADTLNIEEIAREVFSAAKKGRLLLGSDHGYDLVLTPDRDIVVTHGFKLRDESSILLPLSRLAVYSVFWR
ncbi:MAG: hypothetical protein ABWK01_06475 [Infirmifilum sp.]